ncbi:MAG: hypothetical protein JWO72_1755 [Caulobacteraceae bacterium]|nr:hypothetical protein [Caulobacteraceae bacterium]
MPLASLFALALMTADPQAAGAAVTPPAPASEEALPPGAPTDDYGLVNWCWGALQGHMALFRTVKPELDKLPDTKPKETAVLDAQQIKAGQEYLALYKRATDAAERASPQVIAERGVQARRMGDSIWIPARQADARTQMWSYLGWELPGRCETAAERLYEKSLLSAQALGIDILPNVSAAGSRTVTPQLGSPTPAAPTPPAAPAPVVR